MDNKFDNLRTANYSGDSQEKLSGEEHLVDGSSELPFSISDYWKWAYSDMLRNTQRGVFAEFIVKAALDSAGITVNRDIRSNFEPFDLLGPDIQSITPPCARKAFLPQIPAPARAA